MNISLIVSKTPEYPLHLLTCSPTTPHGHPPHILTSTHMLTSLLTCSPPPLTCSPFHPHAHLHSSHAHLTPHMLAFPPSCSPPLLTCSPPLLTCSPPLLTCSPPPHMLTQSPHMVTPLLTCSPPHISTHMLTTHLFPLFPYCSSLTSECRTALVGVDLLTKDSNGLLGVEKEATNISRFLNRILGLPVKLQNQLFSYFSDTLATIIQQAKKMGRWDGGILGKCVCVGGGGMGMRWRLGGRRGELLLCVAI